MVLLCSEVLAQGGSSGSVRATPVRSFLAAKPVRTAACGILQRISSRATTSCGAAASCGAAVASCGTSVPVPTVAAPVPVEAPACPACSACESQVLYSTTDSGGYSRALASAQYRAANGIKGHVRGELLPGRASSSGVGFATNNPNPRTCLGVPGQTSATCAVVRGRDGWYSTCVR